MYTNVHLQTNEPMERDPTGVLERFRDGCLKSSTTALHETATSYIVKYWYRRNSRNGTVPAICSCTDQIFLVFELSTWLRLCRNRPRFLPRTDLTKHTHFVFILHQCQ